MEDFLIIVCLWLLPFMLVCLFLRLNTKYLHLRHLLEEDITRLEQKYYYLEKMTLLLMATEKPQKNLNFDDMLKIIIDKTDDRTNREKYTKTKKEVEDPYEKTS